MSKHCAICGEKITFASDYNLSKDYKNIKICFTCYEYVATSMKGSNKAIEILKSRYREDIDSKIAKYINSFNVDIQPKKAAKKDEFMDLMSNDISRIQPSKNEEKPAKRTIIRLDKLTEAKKDRLLRIRIISTILSFVFLVFGLLFSFYIFTQGYGAVLAVVMASVSAGFTVVFAFIKSIISIIVNE